MEKPKFNYTTHKLTEFNVEYQDNIEIPVVPMDANRPTACSDLPVTLPCKLKSINLPTLVPSVKLLLSTWTCKN